MIIKTYLAAIISRIDIRAILQQKSGNLTSKPTIKHRKIILKKKNRKRESED